MPIGTLAVFLLTERLPTGPQASQGSGCADGNHIEVAIIGLDLQARLDLDQMRPVRKRWNFLGRRQPQHYGLVQQPVTEKETNR